MVLGTTWLLHKMALDGLGTTWLLHAIYEVGLVTVIDGFRNYTVATCSRLIAFNLL